MLLYIDISPKALTILMSEKIPKRSDLTVTLISYAITENSPPIQLATASSRV